MKLKFLVLLATTFSLCCFAEIHSQYNIFKNAVNPSDEIYENVRTLFILDYSNSMNEFLLNSTKYEMLLDSLKIILSRMSVNNNVGVRIYGHRWGITPLDACRASSLIVPIGTNNTGEISKIISKYSPRGMTPITYSLKQAIKNDFKNFNGEKHIILITDGGENCDESPCKYAMELIKYRKDIKIDVIAFNIDNDDDLEQLECTAVVTKGKLYRAETRAELVQNLNHAFKSKKNVEAKILY